jgi:hypothetical protein
MNMRRLGNPVSRSWNRLYSSCFGALALGDVTVHDHQLGHFAFGIVNRAGYRFQHAPASVFVLDAVLELPSDSALARFPRRFQNSHAVVGMNLLKRRRLAQLRGRVTEHSLVSRAVVQAPSLDVDQGNHIGRVFGDRLENLVFLAEFAVGLKDPQLLDDHQDD